ETDEVIPRICGAATRVFEGSASALPSKTRVAAKPLLSILRVAVELLVRQAHAADEHLVGPQQRVGHAVAAGPGQPHDVVLVHAVAADAEAADERAEVAVGRVAVNRRAAGEEHDT